VLYLHVGDLAEGEGEETPEGHVVRFEPSSQRVIGLTVIGARHLLDRDGHLTVTIPETVEASAKDLASSTRSRCPANGRPSAPTVRLSGRALREIPGGAAAG
jgi:hypothetical protein